MLIYYFPLSLFLIALFLYIFHDNFTHKDLAYRVNIKFQKNPIKIYSDSFPKIVHLIYIPWNKDGKLKSNEKDFDHSFYEKFKSENPSYEIKMWTLANIKKFIGDNYPKYKDIWNKVKHPTQVVDFFRLLVVYHYGGIYWQYDSKQKTDLMCFTPPKDKDKNILLFVESVLNKKFSKKMSKEKIRKGKKEELIRVAMGCFAGYPRNKFLEYCIEKSWKNLNTYEVKNQYDILICWGKCNAFRGIWGI